jgi:hypothetical protein
LQAAVPLRKRCSVKKLTIAAANLVGATVTGITYGDAATANTLAGQTALLAAAWASLKASNTDDINTTANGSGQNNIKTARSVMIDSLSGSLLNPTYNSTSTCLQAATQQYGALTRSKYTASIAVNAVQVIVGQRALTGTIAQGNTTYGDALVAGAASLTNVVGTYTGVQSVAGISGDDAGNCTFANVKGDYKVDPKLITTAQISDAGSIYAVGSFIWFR